MRLLTITFFLIFNLTLFAKSNQIAGEYSRSLSEKEKHTIEYIFWMKSIDVFKL